MEATSQSKMRLRSVLQPIYASMKEICKPTLMHGMRPEQRVLSWCKCPDWYERFAGVRPSAPSFPADLDSETMRFAPEQTAFRVFQPA
jgi:hypothetical protein